jgi:uncharacterized protein
MKRLVGWKLVRHAAASRPEVEPREVVVEDLWVADNYYSRLLGWQFRASPPPGTGLLLVPCRSVHTCWLRFQLHVVLLDSLGNVVELRENVIPWRMVAGRGPVHGVLELPATGEPLPLQPGDLLRLEGDAEEGEPGSLPRSVNFLRT